MAFGKQGGGALLGGGPKIVNTDKKRQDLEQARAQENIKKIQTMLQTGIPFLKHNRKGKIKKRLLKSYDWEAKELMWVQDETDKEQRSFFASSSDPRRVRDIVMVQAANEPDPENALYGGTKTLRKSAGRKAVFKSFSLHFLDRTLDLEFETVALFNEVYEGIKLLVTHQKMAVAQEEYALFYGEQNQKNKMAWVPTTDEQARIYFYNIYTRETSWVPPPGAPRIELEHWEKTYVDRKTRKKEKKSNATANKMLGVSESGNRSAQI